MPFGADTPTPEFVGNSRVRGARSPPGTHRDLTTPSAGTLWAAAGKPTRTVDFSGVKRRSVRRASFAGQVGQNPLGRWTFLEQSGEVCPPAGLHQSKAAKCARPPTFAEQSPKVCPPGASPEQSPKAEPGGGCARRAKKTRFSENFFSPPTRIYKRKRGLLFRKKRT